MSGARAAGPITPSRERPRDRRHAGHLLCRHAEGGGSHTSEIRRVYGAMWNSIGLRDLGSFTPGVPARSGFRESLAKFVDRLRLRPPGSPMPRRLADEIPRARTCGRFFPRKRDPDYGSNQRCRLWFRHGRVEAPNRPTGAAPMTLIDRLNAPSPRTIIFGASGEQTEMSKLETPPDYEAHAALALIREEHRFLRDHFEALQAVLEADVDRTVITDHAKRLIAISTKHFVHEEWAMGVSCFPDLGLSPERASPLHQRRRRHAL